MPVKTSCPGCSKTLRAPDEKAGHKVRCPHCKTIFVLPSQSGEAVAAVQKADSWHVQSYDGNRYGPLGKQELDGWVSGGQLTANCQVLKEGDGQWQWAHQLYPQLQPVQSLIDDAPQQPVVAENWFVHSHDGQQYGPIAKGDLDGWIAQGLLSEHCQLRRDGDPQWQPAPTVFPQLASGNGATEQPQAPNPDAAFDGATFDPAKVQTLPAVSLDAKEQKKLEFARRTLEKETKKFGGTLANVIGYPVGDRPQGWLDQLNSMGVYVPLLQMGESEVNPDFFSVVDVAHPSGDLFVVSPRENHMNLPHEFVSIIPGQLPHSIALERGKMGGWGSGSWTSYYDNDPFCAAANGNKELVKGVKWDWKFSTPDMTTSIKLNWTIQAVPLGPTHYLLLVRSIMRGMILPTFGLDWFLERRTAFTNFVAAQGAQQDDGEAQFIYPTDAILPLVGKLGNAIANGHQFE